MPQYAQIRTGAVILEPILASNVVGTKSYFTANNSNAHNRRVILPFSLTESLPELR